jgi:hypothetical protein
MPETDWRGVITDPSERRLFEALEDQQWEWRTVAALSRASGMDELNVRRVLNQYPTLVRRSLTPSQIGEDLYTLQSRYYARQNPLEKGWNFLSSSSSSSSS